MLKGSALGPSDPITSRGHGPCPCRGETWGPKGGTSPIGPRPAWAVGVQTLKQVWSESVGPVLGLTWSSLRALVPALWTQ